MDINDLARTLGESFLESLPEPVWVKDLGHCYVAVNVAFRRLCEYQAGGTELEVIDVTDFNLFPLEIAEQSLQEELDVMTTREAKRGELYIFNLEGQARQFETRRMALLDDSGAAIGTLGMAFDVTDQAQHLLQVGESERQLSQLVGKLPVVA